MPLLTGYSRRPSVRASKLRRSLMKLRAKTGGPIGIPGGARFYTRQLKRQRMPFAQHVPKWPGHRRLTAEGIVLRPAALRTALRGG